MMGKFSLKNLFGSGVSELVKSVTGGLDGLITNKEEKLAAQKAVTEVLLNFQANLDSEVTERLKIDMNSDNKLSKNIRPASLIFTTTVVTAMAISHGNIGSIEIDEAYILLFKTLMVLQYTFYFGSRGIEKIVEKLNSKDKNK